MPFASVVLHANFLMVDHDLVHRNQKFSTPKTISWVNLNKLILPDHLRNLNDERQYCEKLVVLVSTPALANELPTF